LRRRAVFLPGGDMARTGLLSLDVVQKEGFGMKVQHAALAVLCAVFIILGSIAVTAQAAEKPKLLRFATVAASVEKNIGPLVEMKLTTHKGEPAYRAEVLLGGKKVKVYLDAKSGREIERKYPNKLENELQHIFERHEFANEADAATRVEMSKPKITEANAKEIALKKAGEGTVKSIKLEHEHGKQVYVVEITHGNRTHEVKVDANSGKVIGHRVEK